jgi:hypothetical protein
VESQPQARIFFSRVFLPPNCRKALALIASKVGEVSNALEMVISASQHHFNSTKNPRAQKTNILDLSTHNNRHRQPNAVVLHSLIRRGWRSSFLQNNSVLASAMLSSLLPLIPLVIPIGRPINHLAQLCNCLWLDSLFRRIPPICVI